MSKPTLEVPEAPTLSEQEQKEQEFMEQLERMKGTAQFASQSFEVLSNLQKAQSLATRVAQGKVVTAQERQFLLENSPDLLQQAKEARLAAERLEQELRSAKTQEEQEQLLAQAMSNAHSRLTGEGSYPVVKLHIEATLTVSGQERSSAQISSLYADYFTLINHCPMKEVERKSFDRQA